MYKKYFSIIQGQQIEVIHLNLSVDGCEAILSLKFSHKNDVYCMVFRNVSNLTINEFATPFEICGFEVLENENRGWDRASKYTVNDFEDGKIRFYCESLEFVEC